MVSPPDSSRPLTSDDVLQFGFPTVPGNSPGTRELTAWVIPQGSEPRWIVLASDRRAAAVLRSWRPFKISTRFRWSVLVAAATAGQLARVPGVITSKVALDCTYWQQALAGYSDDWVPVVHVGNPSHTRKLIIFFVAPEGRIEAVAKVPLVAGASDAILNEVDVLTHLQGAGFTPAPLARDSERGIAAQSWLEGKPVPRTFTAEHMALLERFALAGQGTRVSDYQVEISAEIDSCDLPFSRVKLSRALDRLDYHRELPAFLEHRDFAPWNLKRLSAGQSGAIDWEWAVLKSLPCQDLLRYFYIQDALFHEGADVWSKLSSNPLLQKHLRRFDVPPEALIPLATHYLLRVLCMDWRAGNAMLAEYSFSQISRLLEQKSTIRG